MRVEKINAVSRLNRVQFRVEVAADLQRHGRGVPEHPGQAAGRAVQGERPATQNLYFVLFFFFFF